MKKSDAGEKKIDDDEFARQLAAYERLIHAYIFSLVHDWGLAEEILQETYVVLFQKMGEWDPDKNLYAWARRFAHYEVLNYRSKKRRDRLRFGDEFLQKVSTVQAARSEETRARMEALDHCIEQLSETNRRLLDLVYAGDLEIEDIARESQRTVAATYQALWRIRKALRQCIERTFRERGEES